MTEPQPFDVCGPLPSGTTVLEASAGTGKTFTIAALATRYLAEGLAELSQLMLVTFGRAATQELRERVRERLLLTERALHDPPTARAHEDALVRHLADVPDAEVAVRRQRLTTALATFDAATIATTHGFCAQMLEGLGLAGDSDPDATFVEDVRDLVDEVADDLYLRKYGAPGADEPRLDPAKARSLASNAVSDRHATLVPADASEGSVAAERYRFACAVRSEVDARKRARRLLDYDDLLTRLRDALRDEDRGPAARERVRSRYRVVMVDEFQDTDPVQWEILRLAFVGHTTLVLIGDPKQAIYAFRGADVVTYLAATDAATTTRTLARNWRSDAALLDGLDALLGGAALGDERIVVRHVDAAHQGTRLHDPGGAPLRVRWLRRASVPGSVKAVQVDAARERVAGDVAADVVRLLTSGARLTTGGVERPVQPGDVAVLVRTHKQAGLVRDALRDAGVPVVLTGTSSVFGTSTARAWLVLLTALAQPHRAGLVRAAALTDFLGWTAAELDARGDAAVEELGPQLRRWARVLESRGVAALLEVVAERQRLSERLLGRPDGERTLTDLRHVGATLHAAAVEGRLGTAALIEWLRRRIAEAGRDTAEERSRRLESDAAAVQVVTVHASKGLEFPVVHVPYAWDRWTPKTPDPMLLHAPDGQRLLDVGGPTGPGYRERSAAHAAEDAGEDLRLLYVALTRAQCSVVAWWAPATTTAASALTRLLFGDTPRGGLPPERVQPPPDDDAAAGLAALAARAGGAVRVEEMGAPAAPRWVPPATPVPTLQAADFARPLDLAWRRTSYSALTARAHEAAPAPPGVGSEPEEDQLDDEAAPVPVVAGDDGEDAALRAVGSPLADLPAGAAFGTLVHGVLEEVDTAAPDLAAELDARCRDAVGHRLGTDVDAAALAAGLLPVLETPLGPLAGGRRLRDVAPGDRLAELDFELPLAGGDAAPPAQAAEPTLGAVAEVLRRHIGSDDPLADYPDALAGPALRDAPLRGYLTGSVDAVLRVRDSSGSGADAAGGGDPRYLVVDYKTNWLGQPGLDEPLSAWHYRPSALSAAMVRAHYPLQALLYVVALHRFLRWRQPGYDPERHLGGVLYLFVRGMCGPQTPEVDGVPCGVFGWRPSTGLVEDLSQLLAGHAPEAP